MGCITVVTSQQMFLLIVQADSELDVAAGCLVTCAQLNRELSSTTKRSFLLRMKYDAHWLLWTH